MVTGKAGLPTSAVTCHPREVQPDKWKFRKRELSAARAVLVSVYSHTRSQGVWGTPLVPRPPRGQADQRQLLPATMRAMQLVLGCGPHPGGSCPWGHWVVSGDVCGCHSWGCSRHGVGGGRGAARSAQEGPEWVAAEGDTVLCGFKAGQCREEGHTLPHGIGKATMSPEAPVGGLGPRDSWRRAAAGRGQPHCIMHQFLGAGGGRSQTRKGCALHRWFKIFYFLVFCFFLSNYRSNAAPR